MFLFFTFSTKSGADFITSDADFVKTEVSKLVPKSGSDVAKSAADFGETSILSKKKFKCDLPNHNKLSIKQQS
jgi:hypothetical protein